MVFWIRKGTLWWEPTSPAPRCSWEPTQDFSSSSAGPGNNSWRREAAMLPELSQKASGGGRVRKDFRTSYAYELRRISKYPPTLFSRQTLFPSFQRERQSPVYRPRKGPAEHCQSSRKRQAAHAPLPMGFGLTPSREEGSQVENNPNLLSTSLERALIIDSTVYFKALNGR